RPARADAARAAARRRDPRRARARRRGRTAAAAARAMLGRRAAVEVERRAARRADRARGGAVRRRLIAAALAVVGFAFLPVVAPAAPSTPTLRAGAAHMPLRVPPGAPLAGYGGLRRRALVPDVLGLHPYAFWFKPGEGSLDEIAARALVVYAGETRVTWLAAALVAVNQPFVARLHARLAAGGLRAGPPTV